MTGQTQPHKGVLGRGPAFWGVMVFVTTALVLMLAFSRAIESEALLVMLTLIPCVLTMVMMRASYVATGTEGCAPRGEAQQRYIKRTAIFTSLYLASFGLLMYADRQLEIGETMKFGLALLPGLAIIGVFWAIGRLMVEEPDEFLRMLVIRQSLIATGFAMCAASVWGFLESAGVVQHLDAYWWAVAWFFGLGIGAAANRIRYETWGAV
jgi:hypothetical protein